MNSGAALWASSGRSLPHTFKQPTQHKSPFTPPVPLPAQQPHSHSFHNTRSFPQFRQPNRLFSTTAAAPTPEASAPSLLSAATSSASTQTTTTLQQQQQQKILQAAAEKIKTHSGLNLYPRDVWEGLITESTVKLNKYLEIISTNDRRASGMDNNRQMWASQRISPAILHDKFRHIATLPTMERSQALLSLWLTAAQFKQKMKPQGLGVNAWLGGLILLVMGMVSAGGVTRLTRSGLSMTTWKFTGEKRPTNEQEWEEEFSLYKQSPEYRLHNSEMELKDFKFIYNMEYGHRTLGRVIGLAFTLPLLGFVMSKSISLRTGFGKALVGVLSLGGLQGLIGWWMVKSGLDEKTNVEKAKVSPYRLATHLTIAFTLLIGLTVLKLRARHGSIDILLGDKIIPKKLPHLFGFSAPRGLAHATAIVAFFTAITGAFVAGNDAGLVYNEWPAMGEGYVPGDLYDPKLGLVANCFENPTFVQFFHRNMAYTTFGLSWATAFACIANSAVPGRVANAANRTAFLVSCQALLGIYTLLNYVPIESAALHQFGAMLVLMSATQSMFYTLNPAACVSGLTDSIRIKNSFDPAESPAYKLQQRLLKIDQFEAKHLEKAKASLDILNPAALEQHLPTSGAASSSIRSAVAAAPKVVEVPSIPKGAAAIPKAVPPTIASATASAASKVNKSAAGLFAIAGVSMMMAPKLGLIPTPGKKVFFD